MAAPQEGDSVVPGTEPTEAAEPAEPAVSPVPDDQAAPEVAPTAPVAPQVGIPPNPFIPLDVQQVPGVELTAPTQVGIAMPALQVEQQLNVQPITMGISVAPALAAPGLTVIEGRLPLRVLAVANPENPVAVWARDHEVRYGGLAAGQVDVAVFQSKEGYFTLPEGWTVPGQDIVVESVEPGRVVLALGGYRLALGGY